MRSSGVLRLWSEEEANTWENEDEKGADSSNHTDDLADVRHKYGEEQRHRDPQHRHSVAASPLQLRGALTRTPPPQQLVLDDRPGEQQEEGS